MNREASRGKMPICKANQLNPTIGSSAVRMTQRRLAFPWIVLAHSGEFR